MSNHRKDNISVVLGLFETGLGVGRSLGREGIKVYGFDHKRDIGFYSKYIVARLCPHPVDNEHEFLTFLTGFSSAHEHKPVLFITSDEYLKCVSKNSELLSGYFLFNLPGQDLVGKISDKFEQFSLAKEAGIKIPDTIKILSLSDLLRISGTVRFPLFIKALDVNIWREKIGGLKKGFVIRSNDELFQTSRSLLDRGISFVIQEIIPGPDTCHYKYCSYIAKDGRILLEFTLRKIRQYPIRYGVGVLVESVKYEELIKEGRDFFKKIGYRGVGSAEFKLDQRDGLLKLIELNPRYWQQNSLTTACGMNFPLTDYLEVTDQNPDRVPDFVHGIKWINRYNDFNSFIDYLKEGGITFRKWRQSLKGKKIYSDFAWDDIIPFFYEFRFGLKLFRLPFFLLKKIFK